MKHQLEKLIEATRGRTQFITLEVTKAREIFRLALKQIEQRQKPQKRNRDEGKDVVHRG